MLPVRLQENVIVDAVFELRFTSSKGFSELVPGSAREIFGDITAIEKTPIADLPSQLREMDPNLQHQPTMRMVWEDIILIIGDRTLGIGYGTKYPGWNTFKTHIYKLFECLDSSKLSSMISSVERYSFKYIDFIPKQYYEKLEKPFPITIKLGADEVINSAMKLQIEKKEEFGVSLFEFSAPVQAEIEDRSVTEGTLISIDTVRFYNGNWESFKNDFNEYLENIHLVNKSCFFDAISTELISRLGAEYE